MSSARVPLMSGLYPAALTIAGSDSGGGAGIQADLRTFQAFGVFGTSSLTAVTAQNPKAVTDIVAVPPATVARQIEAVLGAFAVRAIKTGMLFNADIISAVAKALHGYAAGLPLVVDPVMVATSGARLLREEAMTTLAAELLPLARVITPNLPEAEILLERRLTSRQDMRGAARELARRYDCFVIVKGGHLAATPGVDMVSDGRSEWELHAPTVATKSTHGTGCVLSAAIAAGLAGGQAVLEAMVAAKAFVHASLQCPVQVGPGLWAMGVPSVFSPRSVSCVQLADADREG